MDIGIDLGTTHSVIAVKGQVDFVGGYPQGWYIDECDVTIIPTPDGDKTFPSVLWVNPDDPEDVLVGYEAKLKAEEGDSPIMFSKRLIGTDQELRVSGHTYTACKVATGILRHLKRSAAEALGKPVDRAVLTHPAYYSPGQIEEIRNASKAAGLDVAAAGQLISEPVAAALAYVQSNEQDPITVMTYDLGGGSLDVTVLERRDGVITMKAFDGSALLGGYSFDRALVRWILDKAVASGRTIPYDPESAEDRSRRARLLVLAELIKIRLSERRTDREYTPVRAPDLLVDDAGKTVPFQERINREEFAALIADDLDETIECCRRALAKAGVEPEQLDMILLLGGSTFGPWVQSAIATGFPDVPVAVFEQDSCVAAGAAIQAAELPALRRGLGIQAVLEVPAHSALPFINVTGIVTDESGSSLPEEFLTALRVYLRLPDGSTPEPTEVRADGRFLFEDAELEESAINEFTLRIVDGDGRELLSESFAVEHHPLARVTGVLTVLPKPISIRTARGLMSLAEEGMPLPARVRRTFTRIHDDPTLSIAVHMEDQRIGTIDIVGIPGNAGKGARVELEVEITQSQMRGFAQVFTRGGSKVAESIVRITFPPTSVPSLTELRTRFEVLEDECLQEFELCLDPRHRLLLGGKGRKLAGRIETLFREQEPDRQEIEQRIREFEAIVRPPAVDMDPPRARFVDLTDKCSFSIRELGEGPQAKSYRERLDRIASDGEDAYATKNHKHWCRANDSLAELHAMLSRPAGEVHGQPSLPPTFEIKEHFLDELEQLKADLAAQRRNLGGRDDYETVIDPRCDRLEERIDAMIQAVEDVEDDLQPEQGLAQLRVATRALKEVQAATTPVGEAINGTRRQPSSSAMRTPGSTCPAEPDVAPADTSSRISPTVRMDHVHFAVTSPSVMARDEFHDIDVWAHLERQREKVRERAREEHGTSYRLRSAGPAEVEYGTTLQFRLSVDGLVVAEPERTVLWIGEIGKATFTVGVPGNTRVGSHPGRVSVRVDGLEIAALAFTLIVGKETRDPEDVEPTVRRHRTAFASYASSDRREVFARIQGLEKAGVEVFVDVKDLRSGDRYPERLSQAILERDVLYLFWSRAARPVEVGGT